MISPTTASKDIAQYFIAQHVPDVFRREPRNVGVLVEKNGAISARFIGESPPSEFDHRQLRGFKSPKAYRMWVRHWRKTIAKHPKDWRERLLTSDGMNFVVIPGGEVADTGADSVTEVCAYLYSLLVSEGGLREALGEDEQDEAQVAIISDVRTEFKNLGIMKSQAGDTIKRPVIEDYSVRGSKRWHPVTFYQENEEEAWVIEPISFATRQKSRERDHAGLAAYIFSDLRRKSQKNGKHFNTVSVVRVADEDRELKAVKYALELLEDTSDVVNWLKPTEKTQFLESRDAFARS